MASPVLLSETGAKRARQAIREGAEKATWELMCFIRRNLKVVLRARKGGREEGRPAPREGSDNGKGEEVREREWDRGTF